MCTTFFFFFYKKGAIKMYRYILKISHVEVFAKLYVSHRKRHPCLEYIEDVNQTSSLKPKIHVKFREVSVVKCSLTLSPISLSPYKISVKKNTYYLHNYTRNINK